MGSVFRPSLSQPPVTCPKVLEFRQLIQYKPLTEAQRHQLFKAREAFGKYVAQREGASDALLPEDPREESQKIAAEELRDKVQCSLQSDQCQISPAASPEILHHTV